MAYEHYPEVKRVKRALAMIDIVLDQFGVEITRVTKRPRPIGFDFNCRHPDLLKKKATETAALSQDNRNTRVGRLVASQSAGDSFREIGGGAALHLIVASTGSCNVHLDTRGFVSGKGEYNFCEAVPHLYWDLLGDKVPGLFGTAGSGVYGLRMAAMRGLAGEDDVVFSIGIGGTF